MDITELQKYIGKKIYTTIGDKKHIVTVRQIIAEEGKVRVSLKGKPFIALLSELSILK